MRLIVKNAPGVSPGKFVDTKVLIFYLSISLIRLIYN